MDVFTLDQMINIASAYMEEINLIHEAQFIKYYDRCASIDLPFDDAEALPRGRKLVIKQKSDFNANWMEIENNVISIESPATNPTPIIFNTEKGLTLALRRLIPQKKMTFEYSTMKRLISIEEKLDKILARDG